VKRTLPSGYERILIACIGNIFLGDDGFGVEVARRLTQQSYPEGVQVIDFGIRGLDLAYTLLDGYDALVLVDAVPRGGQPGTLYLLEPELTNPGPEQGAEAGRAALAVHSMDPAKVLAFARTLGALPIYTLIVGCEPTPFITAENAGDDSSVGAQNADVVSLAGCDMEMQVELSQPVEAAVDKAVEMINELIGKLRRERGKL
jgi:hydrogenase maturation protease